MKYSDVESFNIYLIKAVCQTQIESISLNFFNYKKGDILPNEITNTWLFRFKEFLEERGISASNRVYCIKAMLSILNRAKTRGYNLPFNFEEIKTPLLDKTEARPTIYLNRDELKLIEQYKPKHRGEFFTRALFLVCCYTGLSYCDAMILSEKDFYNGEISFTSNRTKASIQLPLHPLVPGLIKQIRENMIEQTSVKVYVQRNIMHICMNVGIDDQYAVYRRGKLIIYPKWMMLDSQTARKTFATNMYLDGYPFDRITRSLAHGNNVRNHIITLRYICTSRKEKFNGTKTYLNPGPKDSYDRFTEIMSAGVTFEQACSILLIQGIKQAEVERIKIKYETNEKKAQYVSKLPVSDTRRDWSEVIIGYAK